MFTWLDGEGTLTSVEAKSRRCEVGSSESMIEITVSIEDGVTVASIRGSEPVAGSKDEESERPLGNGNLSTVDCSTIGSMLETMDAVWVLIEEFRDNDLLETGT